MRHHCYVAPVGRAYSRHIVVAAVRIAWVAAAVVFCHDVILGLGFWQMEPSFAVCYPYSQLVQKFLMMKLYLILY